MELTGAGLEAPISSISASRNGRSGLVASAAAKRFLFIILFRINIARPKKAPATATTPTAIPTIAPVVKFEPLPVLPEYEDGTTVVN